MTAFKTAALAFRYLWSRPLQAVLNLLLFTLGLAVITFVLLVSQQVGRAFQRDLAGIDLVVGAKGSPMQLILAGVFNVDEPPGNVPAGEVAALRTHPLVDKLIPLTLADNFRGARIVGTSPDYLAHYKLQLAQGQVWERPMEVVVGAQVAQGAAMVLGDTFFGSHGLAGAGQEHAGQGNMYRVKGILAPCGCAADRLVLTATESVWQVHEPKERTLATAAVAPADPSAAAVDPAAAPAAAAPLPRPPEHEVTMALITYKSPQAAATLPRYINGTTTLQAAAPAAEVSRILRILGMGTEILRGMSAVLLFTAALSVFIALWNAVRERREDLAMLRMLGATAPRVSALLMCEAVWLALMASVLGLAAGHALAGLAGQLLEARHSLPVSGSVWLTGEAWIPVAALGVSIVAALIPAIMAYRIDVAQLLNGR
jgi:putative ABC transport system permease protein